MLLIFYTSFCENPVFDDAIRRYALHILRLYVNYGCKILTIRLKYKQQP
jgi:hypothetical protein